MNMNNNFKVLDCTLRDGGYYTNWDFDNRLVHSYIESFNNLPADYLEIGYRSTPMSRYLGEYFYCPIPLVASIKSLSNKKIAIILNEKDVQVQDLKSLLSPCKGLIDMVRIAIDPKNIGRALILAQAIKKFGFEVCFNVMYMSTWRDDKQFLKQVKEIEGITDYFYMVDSFGGVYPEDVKETFDIIRSQTNVPIGFHGHNNLELALINTIMAIECGASIVDATITGMGRGAGNLSTELLFTALNAKMNLKVDFNSLSNIVREFKNLQLKYEWGTNLPYMVSGANSLPQKEVMDWVGKNRYSYDSIINALQNRKDNKTDNLKLPLFSESMQIKESIIVGGGKTVLKSISTIMDFLKARPSSALILSSSRFIQEFKDVKNPKFVCLVGNEGVRLNKLLDSVESFEGSFILPPFPREMGTFLPPNIAERSFELKTIDIVDKHWDSPLSISLQVARLLSSSSVKLVGFDGYDISVKNLQFELAQENQYIFDNIGDSFDHIEILTPTSYKNINQGSIYSYF